jgi:5-methylcytosine-specific restriction endonuclease McrA
MIPKRYYLHGDAYELIPGQYYCALCDSFVQKEHFYSDALHKVNNQEKYIGSLERFKNASKKFLKNNSRPSKVVNLFSDIPKKKYGKFYNWLKKQKERDDPIGDLANDVSTDKSFPTEVDSYKTIKNHMIFKRDCDEAIQALKEAFDEFNIKNKNRSGISLKLRFEIFKTDNYKCRLCGASAKDKGVKLEVDHILPIAKGGTDDKSNLWTLCFKCNRGKGISKL